METNKNYVIKIEDQLLWTNQSFYCYLYLIKIMKYFSFLSINANVGSNTTTFSSGLIHFIIYDDFLDYFLRIKNHETLFWNFKVNNFANINGKCVKGIDKNRSSFWSSENRQQRIDYYKASNSGTYNCQWVLVYQV